MMHSIFTPADLLLPQGCDLHRWSVIACDQYTADPGYWEKTESLVGDAPSTLRLILPEVLLGTEAEEARIASIAAASREYCRSGLLQKLPQSYIYLERTMPNGVVQRGVVGKVDLMAYDYAVGSRSPIRATEGTILSRIPPRMRVRQANELECPHILLLADDRDGELFAPLAASMQGRTPIYDFTLMQGGGALRGYAVSGEEAAALQQKFDRFAEASLAADPNAPVYAVGDGNHSLATARACYDALRDTMPQKEWETHPARYALVQLTDLHDPSMQFEAIHRVVFHFDPQKLLEAFCSATGAVMLPDAPWERRAGTIAYRHAGGSGLLQLPDPDALAVAVLQQFLDRFLPEHPEAELDYIHGEASAEALAEAPDCLALLPPPIDKSTLLPAVARHGSLPRKTFSTGSADEKRFYLECRRIVRP